MALDPVTPGSRRTLLAAAVGAAAAAGGGVLGRPVPVHAGSDGDVVLGGNNAAATTTTITQVVSSSAAFAAVAKSGTGIQGFSESRVGVLGSSTSAYGVYASSSTGEGMHAETLATSKATIVAQARGGSTGVLGYSGPDTVPAAPSKTGVYGYAIQDANSSGVSGRSAAGRGVTGIATTGRGVYGSALTGTGVYASTATRVALKAVGRVVFGNCAGVASISAGTKTATVSPGINLETTSSIVATLQGNAGGASVERVAIDPTANTFTIYLTKNSNAAVRVAWHVFN